MGNHVTLQRKLIFDALIARQFGAGCVIAVDPAERDRACEASRGQMDPTAYLEPGAQTAEDPEWRRRTVALGQSLRYLLAKTERAMRRSNFSES
jgi:hypothetical protein